MGRNVSTRLIALLGQLALPGFDRRRLRSIAPLLSRARESGRFLGRSRSLLRGRQRHQGVPELCAEYWQPQDTAGACRFDGEDILHYRAWHLRTRCPAMDKITPTTSLARARNSALSRSSAASRLWLSWRCSVNGTFRAYGHIWSRTG